MSAKSEIKALADFIMAEVEGEPQSGGAGTTAIRIIKRYKAALEVLAKLGNEPELGNSDGNRIAQRALGL